MRIKTYQLGDQLERHFGDCTISSKHKTFSLLFWKLSELDFLPTKSKTLPSMIWGILSRELNCVYIGDTFMGSEAHLMRAPRFGRACISLYRATLAELGLPLSAKIDGWKDYNPIVVRRKLPHNPKDPANLLPLRTHLKSIGVLPAEDNLSL